MVLDIKSVVRSTTREHVKQKYVVASPLMRILWNKDSDFGFGLWALGLYLKVFVQKWYFMTFDEIGAFLMSFSAFLMLIFAFLTPFFAFLTKFCAFLSRNLILEKIYRKKLSKADKSAIFKLSGKLSISI